MRKLIYSMSVSLDGFIAGPDGEIDWSVPDEELYRFHNRAGARARAGTSGAAALRDHGYWETRGGAPDAPEPELEFARIWKELPKVVFSRTLETVEGNARAGPGRHSRGGREAEGGAGQGPRRRRRRPRRRASMELGLIDEFRPFVIPVVLGGGTPFFPALDGARLELVETRTFGVAGRIPALPSRTRTVPYNAVGLVPTMWGVRRRDDIMQQPRPPVAPRQGGLLADESRLARAVDRLP